MHIVVGVLLFVLMSCGDVAAQRSHAWSIQVLDITDGDPIQGMAVTARGSGLEGKTDAEGRVVFDVVRGEESIWTHGDAHYGYHTGVYPTTESRTVWLTPYGAFHKTSTIPVTGTSAPIVFGGVTDSSSGPTSYAVEVEVADGVLSQPIQVWLTPVPPYGVAYPKGSDALIGLAGSVFVVELRDQYGKDLDQGIDAPGVRLTVPLTYRDSTALPLSTSVKMRQRILTQATPSWEAQPELASYDPNTQTVSTHIRSSSWWLVWNSQSRLVGRDSEMPRPMTSDDNVEEDPPEPSVAILAADCVRSKHSVSTGVVCGVVTGSASASIARGDKVGIGSRLEASIEASLKLSSAEVVALLTRLQAKTNIRIERTPAGELESTNGADVTVSVSSGDAVGSDCECYSGTVSMFAFTRDYTCSVPGVAAVTFPVNQGLMTLMCLTFDTNCGEGCHIGTAQHKKVIQHPGGDRHGMCADSLLRCP